MQKQNGSSFQNGAVFQWLLSWLFKNEINKSIKPSSVYSSWFEAIHLKQFMRSVMQSFSILAFLMRFRSFFLCRSSFNFLRVSLAISFFSASLSSESGSQKHSVRVCSSVLDAGFAPEWRPGTGVVLESKNAKKIYNPSKTIITWGWLYRIYPQSNSFSWIAHRQPNQNTLNGHRC